MPDPAGVLITRPEPGAAKTAAAVAALGFQPVVAPLLTIRALHTELPPSGLVQAILLTSGSALAALPASHRHLPLFAVGDATAAAARAAGFQQVDSADGDASALAALLQRRCDPRGAPLLLVTGRGLGGPLAADLRQRGFSVVRRAVYATVPIPTLPANVSHALASGTVAAAMFFSAETARHAVALLQAARVVAQLAKVEALAIGQPAGVALEALPWRRIRVAARPNQDAMLALLRCLKT